MKNIINQFWKVVPIGVIIFFTATLFKSLTLGIDNVIAFSLATILLITLPPIFKRLSLKEKINNMSPQTVKILFTVILVIHFVFMTVISLLLISEPENDLGTIYHSALEIVENGKINTEIDENTDCYKFYGYSNNDYFNNCQNNIMLLLILTFIYKIMSLFGIALTFESTLIVSQIFNIICIEIAIFLGIRILKKKTDTYTSLIYLVLSCLFLPYYINSFRFYTDTIVLPFLMLLISLFFTLKDKELSKKQVILNCILLGIIAFFAIKIKQSIAIVVIAMIAYLIFQKRKQLLLYLTTIFLPTLLIFMTLFNLYIHKASWIDFSREEYIKLPTLHWIALGMTGNGSFNESIVKAELYNETTIKEKEQIVKHILKAQFATYENFGDFLDFEFEKAVSTWCDGRYHQTTHVKWFYFDTILQDFLVKDGKYYDFFRTFLKIYSFFFIVCFLQISVKQLKEKDCPNTILYSLIILGLAIFLSIWETKSRYLLSFIPIFLLLISLHLAELSSKKN